MKRFVLLFVILALLLALCACGRTAPAEMSELLPTAAPTAEPTDAPVWLPTGEASMCAEFQAAADGVLYSAAQPLDGVVYVPELLGEEYAYLSAILLDGDTLYFIARESFRDDDPATLGAYGLTGGSLRVLAEDVGFGGAMCLLDGTLLYNAVDGIRALDPATGAECGRVEGADRILGACNGWALYAKDDGTLCRNDASCQAEAALDGGASFSWLAAGPTAIAALTPDSENGGTVLRLFDWLGRAVGETAFADEMVGMTAYGDGLYLADNATGEIVVCDIADGTEAWRIPLPGGLSSLSLLYVGDAGILWQGCAPEGGYQIWRMDADGSNAVQID